MRLQFPLRFTAATTARFVLSLLIAFGIWAFVINERDPDTTRVESGIEIEVVGLDEDNFRIVDSLQTAEVTLKGPESVVQSITADQIVAWVDMTGVNEPNVYERDVELEVPDGLRDVDVEPSTVMVEIDSVVSKTFDVTVVEPTDSPATLTSISLSTSTVTLEGVRSNVEDVERVEVEVLLSGRTESFTYAADVVPIGPDGSEIDDDTIKVVPATIQVSVEFEVGSRSVPIIVQCACPIEGGGLEIRDYLAATAIPPTVRIEGPQPLIATINAIRTVPIDVENMEVSGFVAGAVDLDTSSLPEGVTVETPSVGVYIQVEPSTRELVEQEVLIVNPPPDTLVDVSPTTISFELDGPEGALALLTESPPIAIIDLSGYDQGTYTLTPRIALPSDVRVVNLEPTEVEVTIEPLPPPPTPTPTPTPVPTGTSTTSSPPDRRLSNTRQTFSDTIN